MFLLLYYTSLGHLHHVDIVFRSTPNILIIYIFIKTLKSHLHHYNYNNQILIPYTLHTF